MYAASTFFKRSVAIVLMLSGTCGAPGRFQASIALFRLARKPVVGLVIMLAAICDCVTSGCSLLRAALFLARSSAEKLTRGSSTIVSGLETSLSPRLILTVYVPG